MLFRRFIPPAAAPLYPYDILQGITAIGRGGKEISRFTSELKGYYNKKYCFLVSSGKAALAIILESLKKTHPNRDHVLIPAFTCYSIPSAVVRAGLKISLCDNDQDTLDFNFDQLSQIISEKHTPETASNHSSIQGAVDPSRLLAVLPTHMFGLPSDPNRLKQIVQDREITIIEDAAQAMGGEKNGQKLGTLGDVSFFSLGRGKSISTVEGGVILTDRDDIAQGIRSILTTVRGYTLSEQIKLVMNSFFLSIFQCPSMFWFPKSLPFLRIGDTIYNPYFAIRKLSSFQAGLAWQWQKKIAQFTASRKKQTIFWKSSLPKEIDNRFISGATVPALIRYPVLIENREVKKQILRQSERQGLGIMFTYPAPINRIKQLENMFSGQEFPVAEKLSDNIVTLPIHPYVSERDRIKIYKLLHEIQVFS